MPCGGVADARRGAESRAGAGVGGGPPAAGYHAPDGGAGGDGAGTRNWRGRRRGWRTTNWIRRSSRRCVKRPISSPLPAARCSNSMKRSHRPGRGLGHGANRSRNWKRKLRPMTARPDCSNWRRRNSRWKRTSWKMRVWIWRAQGGDQRGQLEQAAREHAAAQREPAPAARPAPMSTDTWAAQVMAWWELGNRRAQVQAGDAEGCDQSVGDGVRNTRSWRRWSTQKSGSPHGAGDDRMAIAIRRRKTGRCWRACAVFPTSARR